MPYSKTVRSGVNLEPLYQYFHIGRTPGSCRDGLLCERIEDEVCNELLPPSLLPWKSWPRDHQGSKEQQLPLSLTGRFQQRRLKPMLTIDDVLNDL
jgi:hypothetical protein